MLMIDLFYSVFVEARDKGAGGRSQTL